MHPKSQASTYLHEYDCLTAFGNAGATHQGLIEGKVALQLSPVSNEPDADRVPLALTSAYDEVTPPRWLHASTNLLSATRGTSWGTQRFPVIISSSNFGIDQMQALYDGGETRFNLGATPEKSVKLIAETMGWGPNRFIVSNACISAQLALIMATRLLDHGMADKVLVFSFDFLSRFVVGGFHALKILNEEFPQPYSEKDSGSIGLGDGAAYAVLSKEPSAYQLTAAASMAENHHMTANDPSGAGFRSVLDALKGYADPTRLWAKGHGTGTLEAGRLEAESVASIFPEAPLVSWKGSLGHTLGSCGLVELAIILKSFESEIAPGNVGGGQPHFTDNIQPDAFSLSSYNSTVFMSSAFGGAQAAHLLTRA